jgi:hypothetical protein
VEKIWTVTATEDDCVELVLEAGPPGPLVAAVTGAELHRLVDALRPVDEAVRRNEFDRSQLASICRDTIGRDPFEPKGPIDRRPGPGHDFAMVFAGVVGATGDHVWWLRLIPGTLAAISLYRLAVRAWRRLRKT